MKIKLKILFLLLAFSFSSLPISSFAKEKTDTGQLCAVYLTGIGCPACAQIEPFLFSQTLAELPQLVIIEYEIYQFRQANQKISQKYFDSFLCPGTRAGIPALVFNQKCHIGPSQIKEAVAKMKKKPAAPCPLPKKESLSIESLIPSQLAGRPRIWTKNRVFILESDDFSRPGQRKRDTCVSRLIQAKEVTPILQNIDFEMANPKAVNTSRGAIQFQNAVKIGNWRLQWDPVSVPGKPSPSLGPGYFAANWLPLLLAFILGSLLTFLVLKWKPIDAWIRKRKKDFFITSGAIALLAGFFLFALGISPSFLSDLGYKLPLPLFTFIIALVDGFNPCNMFVLTVLLTLLISSSASRKRFYLVGFIFVLIVFAFYLFFMAAWLNIFKYLHFAGPLRLIIAVVAISAGLINCKEFLFFKKGPSLMISQKHKGKLYAKMRNLTEIVNKGSLPLLIGSSITLAVFSSLVEIPCTAGFPILYTSVLSGHIAAKEIGYFSYLIFYNLVYVFPLLAIIAILGFTFQAKKVSQRQVQIIKLIGGIIMILLGIILLANPDLIGAAI